MNEVMVDVSGLRKVFRRSGLWGRRRENAPALDGVNFRLEEGDFAALVGESGSGKTTLGRCLMGLLPFQAEELRVAGFDVGKLGRRDRKAFHREAQMVFQNPYASLDPAFRVRTILGEAVRVHRELSRRELDDEVERVARRVQLPLERLEEFPSSLSGGERRRVAFARTLATRARFVVTDEPVAGLDPPIQVQLLELMRRVHARRGITFLLISHDLRTVRTLATRVLVLYRGCIAEDAPADRFFAGEACHPYSRELLESASAAERHLQRQDAGPSEPREPGGCAFRHRCGRADVDTGGPCATMTPPVRQLAPNHRVTCHKWQSPSDS